MAPGTDEPSPPAINSSWPRPEDADLKSDVRLLKYQVEQLSQKLDRLFDNYATKTDLTMVQDDVKSVKDNIAFIVKIVIAAVAAAVMGTVIVKGGGGFH